MTPEEFEYYNWKKDTKVNYKAWHYTVIVVDFESGELVLKDINGIDEVPFIVHYSKCKLIN